MTLSKVAIVTGGSRGIGREVALGLAERNYRVALVATAPTALGRHIGYSMIYESKKLFRNLWQDYRVANGQVELRTWLKTIVIPGARIESVKLERPLDFHPNLRAIKLDLADLFPHVSIRRDSGMVREFRFTPEDPEGFIKAVQEILPR